MFDTLKPSGLVCKMNKFCIVGLCWLFWQWCYPTTYSNSGDCSWLMNRLEAINPPSRRAPIFIDTQWFACSFKGLWISCNLCLIALGNSGPRWEVPFQTNVIGSCFGAFTWVQITWADPELLLEEFSSETVVGHIYAKVRVILHRAKI